MPSFIEQLKADYETHRERQQQRRGRDATTTIGADTIAIDGPETTQQTDGSALVSASLHGVPRGTEALQARQISETQPMQLMTNVIVDQLLGGDLQFPAASGDDGPVAGTVDDLRAVMRDVLDGPHLHGEDFDALVSAWVADLVAVGHAYAECLRPASDAVADETPTNSLPVAALKPVDPLTIRHDVDDSSAPADPPYYQVPVRAGDSLVAASGVEPTPLQQEDLLVFQYPGSSRSHRLYPLSPAIQVQEWLELLDDSTTHHSRYYSDNQLPPGLLTARDATDTDIENVRDELEAAKGDPREAPVVGTDARWVEVGGTAVDLSVIEEQQWFLQLVAAAFGVSKQELGLVEDVNRSTAEVQLTTIHKRVTQPLSESLSKTLTRQFAPQFGLYDALGRPFEVELRHSDPGQEQAREEHLRARYKAGGLTLAEYRERVGDPVGDETTVEINGEMIDYAAHPWPVVEQLFAEARSDSSGDAEGGGDGESDDGLLLDPTE